MTTGARTSYDSEKARGTARTGGIPEAVGRRRHRVRGPSMRPPGTGEKPVARKKKNEWVIDEWDESLDAPRKEQQDSFRTVSSAPADDEWGMDPLPPAPEKKPPRGKRPKWIIPAVCGVCAALALTVTGFLLLTGKENPPAGTGAIVTAGPETQTPEPATATPEPGTPTPEPATATPEPATPTPEPATPEPGMPEHNEWYDQSRRYYYHQLTDHEKLIFGQIYDGIMNFRKEISISTCTQAEMDRVRYVLAFDSPELFQTEGGSGTSWSDGTGIIRFDPDYRMDQDEYDRICAHIHGIADELRRRIPSGADDYTAELAINTYMADHCEYLVAGDDTTRYADASLYRGKAQCSGYSRGFLLLLRVFGIESMSVQSSDHEWEIVRINGNWYHADSTWDDGLEEESGTAEGNRFFSWLNVPDRLVRGESHRMDTGAGFTVPACTEIRDNYAVREGVYIAAGTGNPAAELAAGLEDAHRSGKNAVVFLIDDPEAVRDWEEIQNRFFYDYHGTDWGIYAPDEEGCLTGYAVWNDR